MANLMQGEGPSSGSGGGGGIESLFKSILCPPPRARVIDSKESEQVVLARRLPYSMKK